MSGCAERGPEVRVLRVQVFVIVGGYEFKLFFEVDCGGSLHQLHRKVLRGGVNDGMDCHG